MTDERFQELLDEEIRKKKRKALVVGQDRTGLCFTIRFEFEEERLKEIEAKFKSEETSAEEFLHFLANRLRNHPEAIYDLALDNFINSAGKGGL